MSRGYGELNKENDWTVEVSGDDGNWENDTFGWSFRTYYGKVELEIGNIVRLYGGDKYEITDISWDEDLCTVTLTETR